MFTMISLTQPKAALDTSTSVCHHEYPSTGQLRCAKSAAAKKVIKTYVSNLLLHCVWRLVLLC